MKKVVFAIFTLAAVGLFTNPLFAKYCSKVPECAASCRWMQSCEAKFDKTAFFDIYNCGDGYAAIKAYSGECANCRWDVEKKGGKFYVDGKECR